MKKIKILIAAILMFLPTITYAASGKINVTSSSTVIVGKQVTVTVKLSTGASWEMDLNYDKNYLQLVSGGGEAGGSHMVNTSTGLPSRTYTFTFKALKSGSTNVKIGSYYVVADDFSTVNISASSKTIKIMTQQELEATYSKDNYLKSLSVEGFEINPTFDRETKEYNLTVPEGTSSIKINAVANDSKASITGSGNVLVSEGNNAFVITVRAENGSEREYNLVVNVIDINPIEVEVDGEKYTLVKLRNSFVCPTLFSESEVIINEISIPTCINEKVGYTLVGLKDNVGNISSFVYDNNTYKKYNEVNGQSLKIVIIDYDKKISNFKNDKLIINDKSYNAFVYKKNSNYYIVYGINIENGEKGFFIYDKKGKTLSNFDKEFFDSVLNKKNVYFYTTIIFGMGLLLSTIGLIVVNSSKKKIIKNISNGIKKDNKETRENDIKEVNIEEKDSKEKKRKKGRKE